MLFSMTAVKHCDDGVISVVASHRTGPESRDVNRVPGPRDPKKLPDPGFQTTLKLPPRPLPHSETTGLPAQQGQSRHCSVLSETVATVSLRRSHLVHHYRRAHTTLGRHQSHHVTDHVLGRVDYSGW